MATRCNKKNKNKKQLETVLGETPGCSLNDTPIDLSHLRKPIDTSIFGLREVLRLFETATDEVRRYVAYECDIMYECRICRTIYRSLANFILHKRNYCRESYSSLSNLVNNCQDVLKENDLLYDPKQDSLDQIASLDKTNLQNKEKNQSANKLNSIVHQLRNKQESSLITKQCLEENLSNQSKSSENEDKTIALEEIQNSGIAFQSVFDGLIKENKNVEFMKTQVMEIHDILENNEAIIGSDGKIVTSSLEKQFTCTICNLKFSTKKTLTYHIKYKHNNSCLVYQCPDCQDTFANTWSVFRHLYKIHRKSMAQVKKLRNQIHSNVIRRDEQCIKENNSSKNSSTTSTSTQDKIDVENQQWMNDFEGANDLQRCGGCGRRFERKAALHSHSQFCTKRISVCNTIKENSTRRMQEEKALRVYTNNKLNTLKSVLEDTSKNVIENTSKNVLENTSKNAQESISKSVIENTSKNVLENSAKNVLENTSEIVLQNSSRNVLENSGTRSSSRRKALVSQRMYRIDFDKEIVTNNKEENKPKMSKEAVVCSKSKKFKSDTCNNKLGQENTGSSDSHIIFENDEVQVIIMKDKDTQVSNTSDASNSLESGSLDEKRRVDDDTTSVYKATNSDESSLLATTVTKQQNIDIDDKLVIDCVLNETKSSTEIIDKKSNIFNSKSNLENPVKLNNENKNKINLALKAASYIDTAKCLCIPCNSSFETMKSLMKHMALHFNWYRYECNICFYKSYTKSKCKRHIANDHKNTTLNTLRNHVVRLSLTKVLEFSTDFIEHPINPKESKTTISNDPSSSSNEVNIDSKIGRNLEESCSYDFGLDKKPDNISTEITPEVIEPFEENLQERPPPEDQSLKKMIMEVIFGNTSETTSQEKLTRCCLNTSDSIKSTDCSTNVPEEETNLLASSQISKDQRPIRNRVTPTQKDFLYDLSHILRPTKPLRKLHIKPIMRTSKPLVQRPPNSSEKSLLKLMTQPVLKQITRPVSKVSIKPLVLKSIVEDCSNLQESLEVRPVTKTYSRRVQDVNPQNVIKTEQVS